MVINDESDSDEMLELQVTSVGNGVEYTIKGEALLLGVLLMWKLR